MYVYGLGGQQTNTKVSDLARGFLVHLATEAPPSPRPPPRRPILLSELGWRRRSAGAVFCIGRSPVNSKPTDPSMRANTAGNRHRPRWRDLGRERLHRSRPRLTADVHAREDVQTARSPELLLWIHAESQRSRWQPDRVCDPGACLVLDPDWEGVEWTEADRGEGQVWVVKTIETHRTHGTPPVA